MYIDQPYRNLELLASFRLCFNLATNSTTYLTRHRDGPSKTPTSPKHIILHQFRHFVFPQPRDNNRRNMDGVEARKKSKQDLLNLILPMGGINAWVTFPRTGLPRLSWSNAILSMEMINARVASCTNPSRGDVSAEWHARIACEEKRHAVSVAEMSGHSSLFWSGRKTSASTGRRPSEHIAVVFAQSCCGGSVSTE